MNTGTYDISSLLRPLLGITQSVEEFGMDEVARVLQADLAAHNAAVEEAVREMAEITDKREGVTGSSADGEMTEVDEYGKGPTQKEEVGGRVAWPLRLFQYNVGWTAKYLQVATPADLVKTQINAQTAHKRAVMRDIRRAIFGAANYNYRDHLIDNMVLNVKRFLNADGDPIPNGPNFEVFDPDTHTHYDANNGWLASALTATVNDVIEHGHGGDVRVAINRADETAVRQLAGFEPFISARIDRATIASATGVPIGSLDQTRLDNREIGTFAGATVETKSWVPDDYAFVWDRSDPRKPLKFRQRDARALQGLRLAAENSKYPLLVRFQEAEFGTGVGERTNGAVLYVGGSSYVSPTIT